MSTQRIPPPPPPATRDRSKTPQPGPPPTISLPSLPTASTKLITSSSVTVRPQSCRPVPKPARPYSRSRPNTPPPSSSNAMWQQQQHKTSKYNAPCFRKSSHQPIRYPSNLKPLTPVIIRPPPVPAHVLQTHILPFVPEIHVVSVPPPPPKLNHPKESFSSPAHSDDNTHHQPLTAKRFTNTLKRKKRSHARVRSVGVMHHHVDVHKLKKRPSSARYRKTTVNAVDANQFHSMLSTQGIDTYDVVFTTRVCGIELIAFDDDNNIGALVIKCHTDYAKQNVLKQSLLMSIDGKVCFDMDYEEILSLISSSGRPLTLSFHPNDKSTPFVKKKSTPSEAMVFNDEEDDLRDVHRFPDPSTLFIQKNKKSNDIQRSYTMLYHKYTELSQFQDLTRDIINDKVKDIKRLSKETMTLKTILNTKESELKTMRMNESTEKQKGKEIMDQYHKLCERNIELEKKNMEQYQKIQQLQYDLKQQKIFIREYKRRSKERKLAAQKMQNQRVRSSTPKRHKTMDGTYKRRTHTNKGFTRYRTHTAQNDQNGFHNELKDKLHKLQNEKTRAQPPRRSVPNIAPSMQLSNINYKPKQRVKGKEQKEEEDPPIVHKKRQSAINIFFSHFGKRSLSNANGSESDISLPLGRERDKKKRTKKRMKKSKSKSVLPSKKTAQTKTRTRRVRSNSAESNLNAMLRKETIV
eukprot:182175_1